MLFFTTDRVRKSRNLVLLSRSCDEVFNQLVQGGVSTDELYDSVCKQVFFYYFVSFSPNCYICFSEQRRWPNNLKLAESDCSVEYIEYTILIV